jgi:hypothetical protein
MMRHQDLSSTLAAIPSVESQQTSLLNLPPLENLFLKAHFEDLTASGGSQQDKFFGIH